jgi:glycosyltransferase involved in cell wall biosynthesis
VSISVLYVHHAGAFGGASRSLLELVKGFSEGTVVARLLTQRGNVAAFFEKAGVETIECAGISQFDNTRYGHYRGARWILLLRELWYFPCTVAAMVRALRRWPDTDLVHVNEAVALLAVFLAKTLFGKPVVVHVRSVQDGHHGRLRSRLFGYVLRRYADALIAIDETVRRSLPPGLRCEVIHNSYSPGTVGRGDGGRRLPPKREGTLRIAMVGNLLPLKGVEDFLEAARLCRERGIAADFLLVGGNIRRLSGIRGWLLKASGFARDMETEVARFVEREQLRDSVHLVGFTPEIEEVYASIDVLCFPSHLEAVGRPVFEAAFWRVPSIVALSDPAPDTMVHGETGLCVRPGDPVALADAIAYFCEHPDERRRMGEAAHRLAAETFEPRRNSERVLALYRRLLGEAAE